MQQHFSFDLPGYKDNPYAYYRDFRPVDPVHWGGPVTPNAPGAWYLFRHADCVEVLKDQRFGKNLTRVMNEQKIELPDAYRRYIELFKDAIVFKDPPEHTRLRLAINRAFTQKSILQRAPRIQEIVDELLDPLMKEREFDLVDSFAFPFPVAVVCEILGIPHSDRDRIRDWTVAFTKALSGSRDPMVYERAITAIGETREYISYLLDLRRRQDPRDDLMSEFAHSTENRLTTDEVLTMFYALASGGHETSTNVFTSSIYHLSNFPDQFAELKEHPDLIDGAVDEFLRYETPVHYTFRFAYEDVEIGGKTIGKGDRVMVMIGAGAHDPEVFEDPDALNIRRFVGADALHFGRGPHYCPGAILSPTELRQSIRSFLQRFPKLRVLPQEFVWSDNLQFRGLNHLYVAVD
jgi:cytochrome P450 StaP